LVTSLSSFCFSIKMLFHERTHMEKLLAVASLGQRGLLFPSWVTAALRANDRLKVYLSVLQSASFHASHPKREAPDFAKEMMTAGVDATWLNSLSADAQLIDDEIVSPGLPRLFTSCAQELAIMARPVLETSSTKATLKARVQHGLQWLTQFTSDHLSAAGFKALTHGTRGGIDSLHLLIMDRHKQINQLAGELVSELIDGAHVWNLQPTDHALVAAFMAGLNRTSGLKFNHPGLDTIATRDGERLLLQNDIGTNDAHVLVIEITARKVTLIYSDLHRIRLEFFQSLLASLGGNWTKLESQISPELNNGAAYTVGHAEFDHIDETALMNTLEGIGSHIVFLIDWNHARKRLQLFIAKDEAVALLALAAERNIGHRAWLQIGGERLIFAAMQAVGEGAFRIGDRLDDVIGSVDARNFLIAVLQLACDALLRGQPAALVADETRMLLERHVGHRTVEFDLLVEHAGYCHALAQIVSDGIAHGVENDQKEAQKIAARSKIWERKADHLVMQVREQAERQARWRSFVLLIEQSDGVADALEEAAFLINLIAEKHAKGWCAKIRKVLGQLALAVLQATQDHVKALTIARTLRSDSNACDNDAFLRATWSVFQAERHCDTLLRDARRIILENIDDAASLMLANDLALALENASDCLLQAGYALRNIVLSNTGVQR
jgi:uncharacterized protein Yka (UPF0111/DUF47 family)